MVVLYFARVIDLLILTMTIVLKSACRGTSLPRHSLAFIQIKCIYKNDFSTRTSPNQRTFKNQMYEASFVTSVAITFEPLCIPLVLRTAHDMTT